jgi:hypothetical protein
MDVCKPAEMALLALSALAIAVLGALLPASWAARSKTATALRTEQQARSAGPADRGQHQNFLQNTRAATR